ncbi:hypothetical protein Tco_0606835 [Tanacetum coccineum]
MSTMFHMRKFVKDIVLPNKSFPRGNPTSLVSTHTNLTSPEVNDDIFDPEEDIIENLLNLLKCLLTQSSLANYSLDNDLINTILEMFTDEHALDYSSPPLYDDDLDYSSPPLWDDYDR